MLSKEENTDLRTGLLGPGSLCVMGVHVSAKSSQTLSSFTKLYQSSAYSFLFKNHPSNSIVEQYWETLPQILKDILKIFCQRDLLLHESIYISIYLYMNAI